MKITDEILLEMGFSYEKNRDEFFYMTIDKTDLTIFKSDKLWLYVNNQLPGYDINDIQDIMNIIYSTGFKNGVEQKIREIKRVLSI